MRIVVVGANGGTGREVVLQALERGHDVTAFVRSPEKLDVEHRRLTVAVGNVLAPESLDSACRGAEAVVCALGHKRWFYPNRILSNGTRNIVAAMRKHGARRLICETSLGVGSSFGRLGLYYTLFVVPFILPFYYLDKHRQERVVRESGLEWVIVRPAALTNGPPRGRYRHGPRVGSFLLTRRISRADVASFLLDQLTADDYLRQTPGVAW
ncbi:MAG: NAD(P)-dependent oxidoreductase [Thermoanaerobaculia bacterium]